MINSFAQALSALFRCLINGLVAGYGLSMIGFLVLRSTIGERWLLVSVFNTGLYLALFVALILLPLMLIRRRWKLALLVSPAFVALVTHYMPFYLPRGATTSSDATQISLLTYNLHAETRILDPMITVIREADADMVALQEMSPEVMRAIDAALASQYPYRAFYPEPDGVPYHGRGFLSRYPVIEDKAWPVEYPIPVRLQRVVVEVRNTLITVYNFHAPPSTPIWGEGLDFAPRAQQISGLLALAEQDSGPVILMGDFNIADWDENYGRITTRYHDVYREVGRGIGFTNPDWSFEQAREGLPFIPMHQRPDMIFYDGFLQPLEARIWPTSGGSDHRPVFAILAL